MALTQTNSPAQEIAPGGGSLMPVYGAAIGGLLLWCLAAYLSANLPRFPLPNDTAVYLYRQDRWLLLVGSAILLLASIGLRDQIKKLSLSRTKLVIVGFAVVGFCWLGHYWFLCGFDVSGDEQRAVFDSQIFRSGHLVQQLPPFWQAHAMALNTELMLPIRHPVAWVSDYLPMNAMLRAAMGLIGDSSLTGPLMVALGMLALWKCARILWPDDREAAIVALLLYIGSGQVLFAGMTAYAMPAHLSLDLVWLWLFLLNRRGTDCVALLVGFVATGLHQPLFHPLFAAPILFTLLRDRNWPRIALYTAGYAAICAFWFAWPNWTHALMSGPHSITAATGTDYVTRLVQTAGRDNPVRLQEMAANLLRLFAWQHVLLVPLILAAAPVIRRERLPAAFAVSMLLPAIAMALLLPWQAHGFGYRYMHGVIGVAILLAAYGWRRLVAGRAWLRPFLLRTTALGLFVLVPLQAAMAHAYYAPYARVDRRIAASGADYFIIGWGDTPWGRDLAINRPDLSNRPIRLIADFIDEGLIRSICHQGVRVAMPTSAALHPIDTYFGVPITAAADDRLVRFSNRLTAAGCTPTRLDGP